MTKQRRQTENAALGKGMAWIVVFLGVFQSVVQGLVGHEAPKIRKSVLYMVSQVPSDQPSCPLPPRHPFQTKRRKLSIRERKSGAVDTVRQWKGQSIPDRIPRLSDVLKNGSRLRAPAVIVKGTNSEDLGETRRQKPWKAGYHTSLKSQKRIKDAALIHGLPIERATAVLETFHSISPLKCNAANLVCALTLSAKVIGRETNDHFRSLLFRTTDILGLMLEDKSLSARQLCNVAWALAKHYDRDDHLLPCQPKATALEAGIIGQAETWDLRNDLAGCSAQRVDKLVDLIAMQLTEILEGDIRAAKEGELCMASWAYGILRRRRRPPGWQHGPRLGKLAQESKQERSASHFIKFEQWRSNKDLTVACRDLDVPCATGILLDKIGQALCQSLDPTTSVQDGDIAITPQRIRHCKWSELANVVWAFASHGRSGSCDAQEALTAIAYEASRRLDERGVESKLAQSRDIAQIIWSLGTLQADNFRMADGLIQFVDSVAAFTSVHGGNDRPFKKWSCADIVQVALSLAHARLDELPMLRSLYAEASRRLDSNKVEYSSADHERQSFLVWEISVLLWAQARFYLNSSQGDAFNAFATKAVSSINTALQQGSSFGDIGVGPQEQANIAWSLTVLELYNDEAKSLLDAIFVEAASSCQRKGVIQLEHAHQLWQALFLLEDECPSCVRAVPEWFRDYLQDSWHLEKARPKISSARHRSLSKTLSLMGVSHFNEHDEDIDVAIVLKANASWTHETERSTVEKGMKAAVEFDGPNHFTRQRIPVDGPKPEPPRALGHTVLKYRLLKKQGWTVVRVPYYEFDKIPFWASMERQRYLQRLLKTHGNLRFSDVDVSEYKAQVSNRLSRFD